MSVTFTISQLEAEVILKVENRTTDTSRADVWIRDAILEITSNFELRNEFDQLELYGNLFNLTPQVQEYAEVPNLIPANVQYNVATLDILLWQDPGTNLIRRKLELSHYQKSDNFQPTYSLPTEWYRFGGSIGFTPIPDQAYQVQTRMLQQHPIIYDANNVVDNTTPILLPNDWNEIIILAAAERGFIELLEYEKSGKIHTLLYGDPKTPQRPGLMFGRKKRREQEGWRTEQVLRPIIRRYMY